MMSITPAAMIASALPRPYAGVQDSAIGGSWVCSDHMSTEHNPTTGNPFGSKRLDPGSFVGVLT